MNQQSPNRPEPDYNDNVEPQLSPQLAGPISLSDTIRVIIPPDPPAWGPAAARALLRLLTAVHRKRAGGTGASREAP
jgi:hypothetical protein